MISLKFMSDKKTRKWIWFGLAALAATQLYYVKEMLAAFVLFAVLFAIALVAVVILFVLGRIEQRAAAWAEPHAARAFHQLTRASAVVELGKKLRNHPSPQE